MEQGKVGGHMFAFQYKRNNFLHGDNNVWIFWDEMYQLLQADALEAQLICFVTISLMFIWFIIYHIECLNLFHMPL
jgi:hypothetical protein